MIYADNAATTRLDPAALEAMLPYLKEEYANPSQPYSFARKAKKAIAGARETIAGILGAEPEEIFFTSGGTESDNWAIKGTNPVGRNHIVAGALEHHAVLHACEAMKRQGREVSYVPPERDGTILPEKLKSLLREDTALVTVQLANNETGAIEPIASLAEAAHERGAFFHTDAVQAAGHIPVNVKELGVDLLSASAHKFNGPKGIGFLYRKTGIPLLPYQDGGAQERGNRAGTENVAAIAGMARALEINAGVMEETAERLRAYERILLGALEGMEFRYNGAENHVPGNMSLSFRGLDGEAILHRMDLMGVAISTGSACTSGRTTISHVLKAMGMPEEWARGTVRVSLGRFNTEEEVRTIAGHLRKIAGEAQ
ncbi:MAG: cysteine desulfurase [Clostridia bacterium]|nr:cysteine desulfurase [Clostridia bacterium]